MTRVRDAVVTITADIRTFAEAITRAGDGAAYLAWRMDDFSTRLRDDQLLTVPVRDAWWEFGR